MLLQPCEKAAKCWDLAVNKPKINRWNGTYVSDAIDFKQSPSQFWNYPLYCKEWSHQTPTFRSQLNHSCCETRIFTSFLNGIMYIVQLLGRYGSSEPASKKVHKTWKNSGNFRIHWSTFAWIPVFSENDPFA